MFAIGRAARRFRVACASRHREVSFALRNSNNFVLGKDCLAGAKPAHPCATRESRSAKTTALCASFLVTLPSSFRRKVVNGRPPFDTLGVWNELLARWRKAGRALLPHRG